MSMVGLVQHVPSMWQARRGGFLGQVQRFSRVLPASICKAGALSRVAEGHYRVFMRMLLSLEAQLDTKEMT